VGDPKTKFAGPDRSAPAKITAENLAILKRELFVKALSVFPKIVLVLNGNRQIVYCNEQLCLYLGISSEQAVGKRPGELFGCIHSDREPSGCGTSVFCRECGAVNSILIAQKGQNNTRECRMTIRTGGVDKSLDLQVWSMTFEAEGEAFVIFTVDDIGGTKRRESLERTFFHDVLNEASVIIGYLDNIVDEIMPLDKQTAEEMRRFARSLINTITSQRDLLAAEDGQLAASMSDFGIKEFLKEIVGAYAVSKEGQEKNVRLKEEAGAAAIRTDRVLLGRVIGNLIKNALEASPLGGTVTVDYRSAPGFHYFSVHNDSVMPESVKLQVFQRSFSTKGKGRGIGTYSIKYFTENYLKGKVAFTSEEGKGTIFTVELPA
jgi:signal transduction histidine kinase